MMSGLETSAIRDGGNFVAERMFDEINKEWCGLTKEERAATAEKDSNKSVFIRDGHGDVIGLQAARDRGYVSLTCDSAEQ